jgi:hypothetical protein
VVSEWRPLDAARFIGDDRRAMERAPERDLDAWPERKTDVERAVILRILEMPIDDDLAADLDDLEAPIRLDP